MTTAVVLATVQEAQEDIKALRGCLETGLSAFEQAHAICERFDAAEGWRVLGYRSLAACLAFELQVTRGRAYDLITKMRASVLIDEKEPSREQARKALRFASAKGVAPAAESDQLEEPVTRSPIGDGRALDGVGDEESGAVYECRHCGRKGTLDSLAHCLTLVREAVEAF